MSGYIAGVVRPTVVSATVAALRTVNSAAFVDGCLGVVREYQSDGTVGGYSEYYWSAASTTADDSIGCIKPTNVDIGDPGRWIAADAFCPNVWARHALMAGGGPQNAADSLIRLGQYGRLLSYYNQDDDVAIDVLRSEESSIIIGHGTSQSERNISIGALGSFDDSLGQVFFADASAFPDSSGPPSGGASIASKTGQLVATGALGSPMWSLAPVGAGGGGNVELSYTRNQYLKSRTLVGDGASAGLFSGYTVPASTAWLVTTRALFIRTDSIIVDGFETARDHVAFGIRRAVCRRVGTDDVVVVGLQTIGTDIGETNLHIGTEIATFDIQSLGTSVFVQVTPITDANLHFKVVAHTEVVQLSRP